jgi:SAM-dependent methyltransferase
MSWSEIKAANRKLREVGDGPIAEAWQEFSSVVQRSAEAPPYHLAILLNRIEQYRGARPSGEIAILDHGCGGGLTLLYLAARGYTNIYGNDVGGDHTTQNRIATEILHHDKPRFTISDGKTIPLPDGSIDIVFSQQVLEHVDDAVIDSYFSEESRVLKSAGWAIHQIPHRLAPYDSHTQMWLIQYFPGPIHRALGRMLGAPIPDHLHLRWPWFHRWALKHYIGSCQDLTLERLKTVTNPSYYDGPVRLRRLISTLITMPLLGVVAGAVLRHFVMLETLSVRSERQA